MPTKPKTFTLRQTVAKRPSSHARGYGRSWYKMTAAFRQANPLCVKCLAEGRTTLATVVDHTIPHKGNWELYADPSNWTAMCASCHSRKTVTSDGGFGR
jgi:5-methylcytosine-specific restriction protein A